MTEDSSRPSLTQGPSAGRLAVRGTLRGAVVVAVLMGVAWQVLPADLRAEAGAFWFWSGVGVGLLSAAIGNGLIAFGSMKGRQDPANSTGFIRAVVFDFALQFVCAATCILGLIFKGLKFQQVAAFAITFALAVVICRMFGTVVVSRALVARSRQRITDPDNEHRPVQNPPR